MARPKRREGELTAYERIANTFWEQLSQKGFDKITISSLSKEAGVNHNLIYYYFENIQDMAKQLFEKNLSDELPRQFVSLIINGKFAHKEILVSEEFLKQINRVRLFMKSDSIYLNEIVKDWLQNNWLAAVGVDKKQLTKENLVDLEFIFSGIVSVVGSALFDENPEAVATLYQRTLGKAVVDTLKSFGDID